MIDSDAIDILPKPLAIINAAPLITNISNASITFYNYSVGGDFWDWMFNDPKNSTSSMKNPSFMYLDTGIFRAELIATNLYGCSDTAYVNIVIKDDYTLYIPSAFTPDLSLNNYFGPQGIHVSDYVMYIFDRWGNQLFMTTDLSNTWDGTDSNGNKLPQNVYVYWIQTSDVDGNKHQYNGTVTLLR
jgi:gliding motility-associated-like protein